MKTIPVTKGNLAIVDDEDYEDLIQFRWNASPVKNTCYAKRYMKINGRDGSVYMHRHILRLTDSGVHVDHIDHDGLNNVRSNLRIANYRLNNHNVRPHAESSSKFVGVCWHKKDKKWQAQIAVNGKQTYLGQFNTEREAALVRDEYAKKHYGEFAYLNLK